MFLYTFIIGLIIVKLLLKKKSNILHNDINFFIIGVITCVFIWKNKIFILLLLSKKVFISVVYTFLLLSILILGRREIYTFGSKLIYDNSRTIHNFNKIPKTPCIILCNYPSQMLGHVVHGIFPKKFCLIIWKAFKPITSRFFGKNNVLYTYKNCYKQLKEDIKIKIKEGYYIICYPEKNWMNRTDIYKISSMKTGIFKIAKDLSVPIVPMALDHLNLEKRKYYISVGEEMVINDINKGMEYTYSFLQKKLRSFKYKYR